MLGLNRSQAKNALNKNLLKMVSEKNSFYYKGEVLELSTLKSVWLSPFLLFSVDVKSCGCFEI